MAAPARIESLHVRNYRALRDLELRRITPLTVLIGPNGSGKSTLFDVFAFLAECFTAGLRRAWDRRNRMRELRSRGADGPVTVEVQYREAGESLITYRLAVDERGGAPVVAHELLRWTRGGRQGRPTHILEFRDGRGRIFDEKAGEHVEEVLDSPDLLAVSTLGQLARHPRVSALRRFVAGWYLSYVTTEGIRGLPHAGPEERLSRTGDNLPNVIQYLREQHPDRLEHVLRVLARRVPRLERVDAEMLADGRLLLQIKDAPFDDPVLATFASDGTLKMLAYLTVLHDPLPPPLIGIEEPENHLHPKLLRSLAEECRNATANSQLLVTTHSPYFADGLRPDEVWVLFRGEDGYTRATRTGDLEKVRAFMEEGALLGDLWMEGHFEVDSPSHPATRA